MSKAGNNGGSKSQPKKKGWKGRSARPKPKAPFNNSSVKAQVQKMLTDEYLHTSIGTPGLRYLEAVLDPLGQGAGKGPKSVGAPMPDGSPLTRVTLTATYRYVFSGATSTSGMVQLQAPDLTLKGGRLAIHYGNNPLVTTDSPTATVVQAANEATFIASLVGSPSRCRSISSAIRIVDAGAEETSAGTFHAYINLENDVIQTAAAAWNTYSALLQTPVEEVRKSSGGCTLRVPITKSALVGLVATQYGGSPNYNAMPVVVFSGISATASLVIEAVHHYEVTVPVYQYPFSLGEPGYEPELSGAINYANAQELFVSGNSFWSFMKAAGRGILKTFHFVKTAVSTVAPFMQAIKGVV